MTSPEFITNVNFGQLFQFRKKSGFCRTIGTKSAFKKLAKQLLITLTISNQTKNVKFLYVFSNDNFSSVNK